MQCATMRAMTLDPQTDSRLELARSWLIELGADAALEVASADASFRRYFRCRFNTDWTSPDGDRLAVGCTAILMDAPPDNEDAGQFVMVTRLLAETGLPVPQLFAVDAEQGFVLLTDFGSCDLLTELNAHPHTVGAWYQSAAKQLDRLHRAPAALREQLPPYGPPKLREEMALFRDWLWQQHLALAWESEHEAHWQRLTDALVMNAEQQPRVVVHRDFHSRNLMVVEQTSLGVIDYQDAMNGPWTYDLVSLLRDCYVEWPMREVRQWAASWLARGELGASVSEAQRLRWFFLMGVQRQLKAAGIFARLALRDGKRGYLADVPRTLGYIVAAARDYPELEWIAHQITDVCLPALSDG